MFDVLKFPSVEIRSQTEFQDFIADHQFMLDRRYEYECSLGSHAAEIVGEGTCGACLQRTAFHSRCSDGDVMADGRKVPYWREAMICGCDRALNNRQRALLHLLQAKLGLTDLSQVFALGGVDRLFATLSEAAGALQRQPKLLLPAAADKPVLKAPAASHDLFLSLEYAHHVPDIDALFREASRVLVPGGAMVLSMPFHFGHDTTVSIAPIGGDRCESGQPVHQPGWDILPRICYAGFRDCWMEIFWSEEFGYLGPFNTLIVALKD